MKRFVRQAWLGFKDRYVIYTLKEYLLLEALYPLISLTFYVTLAVYAYGITSQVDWIIGNAFLLCLNTSIFTLGSVFLSERFGGKLSNILGSPVNRISFILEKAFFPYITSIIIVFIGFFIGCYIFNINTSELNLLWFFISIMVGMFSITGFSVLVSCLGLVTDSINFFLNLVTSIIIFMSGANFPISNLPIFLQKISNFIPLKNSIEAARLIFDGVNKEMVIKKFIYELFLGIIFFVITIFAVKSCEEKAKKIGNLEFY